MNMEKEVGGIDPDLIWKKVGHKYIYDPMKKDIRFIYRRPTDYKINKRVCLPKPLSSQKEFYCELRRRKYMATFKAYVEGKKQKPNKKGGMVQRISTAGANKVKTLLVL